MNGQQPTDRIRWLALASAVAAIALGRALQISDGTLSDDALMLVGAALMLLAAAVTVNRPLPWALVDGWLVPAIAAGGVLVQVAQLYTKSPGWFVVPDPLASASFRAGLAAFAVIGVAVAVRPSRPVNAVLVLTLVTTHAFIGASIISHSPHPPIDVDTFQSRSALALLHGVNPYALTFPNIYPDSRFYAPDVVVNGQLQFGFPYLPASLLVTLPATLLAGDHRYAALTAMELAALLMAFSRSRGFGALAAVLYLTTPRIFYVLEMSWTEPLVVLGLAAVVYVACRRNRLVPWLFGAFIALKQYLILTIPAAWLLVSAPADRRAAARFFAIAGVVAAALTLPFVLWGPAAFVNSVVTLQFRQPFRSDSLSFLAAWATAGHPQPSSAIAFAAAAIAAALAVWRLPRTAAGFAAVVSVTFLAFFAFNKQAFCNYYFFVVGALCVTLAASEHPSDEESQHVNRPSRAESASNHGERPTEMIAVRGRIFIGTLVAACLVSLVWIGDAPFINDEPLLIASALRANAAHQLAGVGLQGTYGFAYGPVPTWVYQLLVAATHNLVAIAALHTVLMTATTAFALWWLSRTLQLWPWFAAVPLLSPYVWFYSRTLWDNPFLIPFGALAIAGYAAVLKSESAVGLRVALSALIAVPLVHLMGVAFAVPLAIHMLIIKWRTLRTHRMSVILIAGFFVVCALPYWTYLATAPSPGHEPVTGLQGGLFPLMGGRLLSARLLEGFFGPEPVRGVVLQVAASMSWLAYALVWAGLLVASGEVFRAATARSWTTRAHISTVLLAILACQVCLDAYTGKTQHPQYQNATWIVFTLFAWLAVDWFAARKTAVRWVAPAASSLLAIVLLVAVATLAVRLHRTSGTRAIYGPTIANQQRVARDLAGYSRRSQVTSSVLAYQLYPHALATLRELNPERRYAPTRLLDVHYASTDPSLGAIEVGIR